MGQPELFYPAKSLKIRVFDDIKKDIGVDFDKTVYRIVDYFLLVGSWVAHYG